MWYLSTNFALGPKKITEDVDRLEPRMPTSAKPAGNLSSYRTVNTQIIHCEDHKTRIT